MLYPIVEYPKIGYNYFREFHPVARAREGWGKGDYKKYDSPAKKFQGEAGKQAGKKKGGLGEGILPACSAARSAAWGGKRWHILRQQKGKAENFSYLTGKIKKEGRAKK